MQNNLQAADLTKVLEHVSKLMKLIESIDFDAFDDLTINPTTDFRQALNQSTELKKDSPTFDEMQHEAENQVN